MYATSRYQAHMHTRIEERYDEDYSENRDCAQLSDVRTNYTSYAGSRSISEDISSRTAAASAFSCTLTAVARQISTEASACVGDFVCDGASADMCVPHARLRASTRHAVSAPI
eukprot:IDg975t1